MGFPSQLFVLLIIMENNKIKENYDFISRRYTTHIHPTCFLGDF